MKCVNIKFVSCKTIEISAKETLKWEKWQLPIWPPSPIYGHRHHWECSSSLLHMSHSLNFLYLTLPLLKQCLISAWTQQQKVAYLPGPGCATVEKIGRQYSYYSISITIFSMLSNLWNVHSVQSLLAYWHWYKFFAIILNLPYKNSIQSVSVHWHWHVNLFVIHICIKNTFMGFPLMLL